MSQPEQTHITELHQITQGGSYMKNADGTLTRVEEPTAPRVPGQGADAGPGAVVGTTQGEPPAPAEAAAAPAATPRAKGA